MTTMVIHKVAFFAGIKHFAWACVLLGYIAANTKSPKIV